MDATPINQPLDAGRARLPGPAPPVRYLPVHVPRHEIERQNQGPHEILDYIVTTVSERVAEDVKGWLRDCLPVLVTTENSRLCYDLDQLAHATSLSRRTLESYVADGTLTTTRIGRRLVVSTESARAFLRNFHLRTR